MPSASEMTLEQAREWLRQQLDEGARCPCCTQFAKVYRRTIHASMVRELFALYRADPTGDWLHLPSVLGHGGDSAKLRYWGLIEGDNTPREDGGRAGYWRITQLARDWLSGAVGLPKYAYVYDGRLMRLDGPSVSVGNVLNRRFDLRELMGGSDAVGF